MARVNNTLIRLLAAAVATVALAASLLVVLANLPAGQRLIEAAVGRLSGHTVLLTGLGGVFPGHLRLRTLRLADSGGVWLSVDHLRLDWDWRRLAAGDIWIGRLAADQATVARRPLQAQPATWPPLLPPVRLTVGQFAIGRLELAAAVAGQPASLAIDGGGALDLGRQQGFVRLRGQATGGVHQYQLEARISPEHLAIAADIDERGTGLLAGLARLPQPHPLTLSARLQGPPTAVATTVRLGLGPLAASAQGTLDLIGTGTLLTVAAKAPAMRFTADGHWQTLELGGQLTGHLPRPHIDGQLTVANLSYGGASMGTARLNAHGHSDDLRLTGTLAALRLPQQPGLLLHQQPLNISAHLQQQALAATLSHPDLHGSLSAELTATPGAKATLSLRNLEAAATLTGLALAGRAELRITSQQRADGLAVEASGELTLNPTGQPLPDLLAGDSRLTAAAVIADGLFTLKRWTFANANLEAEGHGHSDGSSLAGQHRLTLKQLATLTGGHLTGALTVDGRLQGRVDQFSLHNRISGQFSHEAGGRRFLNQPIGGQWSLTGLPAAPAAELDAQLGLAAAPLRLTATATHRDGRLRAQIKQLAWRSLHLQGQLEVPPAAGFADGDFSVRVGQLAHLQPWLGPGLVGSLDGGLSTRWRQGRALLRLQATAQTLGWTEAMTASTASLTGEADDLLGRPRLNGELKLGGIGAGGFGGDLRLLLQGPPTALALNLDGQLTDPSRQALKLSAAAQAHGQRLLLNRARADWRQQTLTLLSPLTVDFADGVRVDGLDLGLGKARLSAGGQLLPHLDLSAHLRQLPTAVLALAMPELTGLEADGQLEAHARLTGTLGQPQGTLTATAADLRLRHRQFSLPPLRWTLTAALDGQVAQITSQASSDGLATATVTGHAPLAATATWGLHGEANIDLKLTDPLLNAAGRRLRGQARLVADLSGPAPQPAYVLQLQLTQADARDDTLGVHISDMDALLKATNGVVELTRLKAKVGQGLLQAQGSARLATAYKPLAVDATITAANATVLANDRLTVNADANLSLRSQADGIVLVLGTVAINRAEIRIPERLPARIAVLNVRREADAHQPAPPPPVPLAQLFSVDLRLTTPGDITVLGRGVNAQLRGTVHLQGPGDHLRADGGFGLRRGYLTVAGKSLNFNRGTVNFDGGNLADPALDLVATASSDNITATLGVGGTASKPAIRLSSAPPLPQDEILARLLFNRGSAGLGVTELMQIGSVLALLTGVDTGLIGDPLQNIRAGLGLDRLTVGTSVEAGRYLAPGVYLGATQGLTDANPQATIQINLTRHIKLEASVGGGAATGRAANTNSIGVVYQYEY